MNNAYKHQEQILVQTSTFNSEQQPYVDILVKPEWENRDKVSDSQSIVSNYNHAYHHIIIVTIILTYLIDVMYKNKLQENNVRNVYWGCGSNNPHGFNKSYYYG